MSENRSSGEALDFASADGTRLRARWFAPAGSAWAAVLVAPAIAVEAAYYAPFAAWLAEQGAATLVFDYRGVGASRPSASLRRVHADLDLWAEDEDAALRLLSVRCPDLPLLIVGNSLGAQLAGALASRDKVSGLLAVSMGSGYIGHLKPGFRWQARLFLHALMPLATVLCGYFPGAALRTVGDLPAGAAWQWRRWCLSPQYLLSAEGRHAQYRSAPFALISLYASDDELLGEAGARLMYAAHGNGRAFEVLKPQPGERFGHLGLFKERHRTRHWPRLLQHLRSFQA